ncbi:MAG: DUF4199 domain-containing protein [Flavobacteriaceae bacterium]|nr:DUF4199 domain-containing protein [Flavobacteriaceae bacterium]
METQTDSLKKIAFNFGVILALLSIVLQVISYVLDVHIDRPWWLTVLQTLISIAVLAYGIKAYKTANAGFLTLSQALKVGLAISLVAGIIAVVFNYIFMNYIDPDFVQKTLDFTHEQLIKANMPQDQIEMRMNMSAKLMTPLFMTGISLIATLFFGFIISLFTGLVMKKNPPQQLN